MEELILLFVEWLREFSYFGILIALTFEFVPAELVLPLAGYSVYQGVMNFWLVVLAGTIGGTLGPLTLYALGRFGGRRFLTSFGKYFFIREKELTKAERFFDKHGGIVAFTARFLPGIRTIISIPCGLAKMNVTSFSLYTFAATLPITYCYVYMGFKLGTRWQDIAQIANRFMYIVVIIIIATIIIYVMLHTRENRKT
ncbi:MULTISPECIES: DedA family protein [Bacillaceae]|uniref:DedA family protein n=1 Tax=Bacillaceae TaxID=186817 RepID=UPI001BDEA9AC|nr:MULTISPECIES: DedA family protein [Bacillaceae]MDX8360484.1 DedA family protein [Cytobacillus sp. IB215316]